MLIPLRFISSVRSAGRATLYSKQHGALFLRYGMNERIIPRERCRTEPLLTGNGVISAPFEKFIHTEINKRKKA